MITQDVFPAKQGFPRPPDNGVPAPTAVDVDRVADQAFPPAPLPYPFPAEPPPPATTFPAKQAFTPVLLPSFVLVPPALEVNLNLDTQDNSGDAPSYVVSEVGSLPTSTQQSVRFFTITSVSDYDTAMPPTTSSINLLVNLSVGLTPLTDFGVQLQGRAVYFVAGAWIPAGTTPQRAISNYGAQAFIIPNNDADGNPFPWTAPGVGGPTVGDTVAVDVAYRQGEVATQELGIVQEVVPQTSPLLDELGLVQTEVPVQQVLVSGQVVGVGTPANYQPSDPSAGTSSAGPVLDVLVAAESSVFGLPTNYPPLATLSPRRP